MRPTHDRRGRTGRDPDLYGAYPRLGEAHLTELHSQGTRRTTWRGEDVGRRAPAELSRRGIDLRLNTRVESAVDRRIRLSDGTELNAGTLPRKARVNLGLRCILRF
jgi:hypothetical protein